MDNQPQPLAKFTNAPVHIYKQKKRKQLMSATSEWYLGTSQQQLHLRYDSKIFPILFSPIRIVYEKQTCYYFKNNDDTFNGVCFKKDNDQSMLFEYHVSQHFQIKDFVNVGVYEQETLKEVCGKKIDKEPYKSSDILSTVGGAVGSLFGKLDKAAEKPNKAIELKINQQKEKLKDKNVDEEKKSNWQKFKDSAEQINNNVGLKFDQLTKPIQNWKDKMGEKYDSSDNTVLKGVRNFTTKLSGSLNQNYIKQRGYEKEPGLMSEPIPDESQQ